MNTMMNAWLALGVLVFMFILFEIKMYRQGKKFDHVCGILDRVMKEKMVIEGSEGEFIDKLAYDDVCNEMQGKDVVGVMYLHGWLLKIYLVRCGWYREKFNELGYGL
jgi:hypothetical protein